MQCSYCHYVYIIRLITILKSDSALIEVVDGSRHPIVASGNWVSHPNIQANYVPSFSNTLFGISPINYRGVVGIIQFKK